MNETGLKWITEVQTPKQSNLLIGNHGVWIGARNSANYGIYEEAALDRFDFVGIKRGPGMTIDEISSLHELSRIRYGFTPYIIERGINTIDRNDDARWSPDLRIAYTLKHRDEKIFDRLVVDCSHSGGRKEYTKDIYKAFKAIGVKHFMFEVYDGKSKTDKNHVLSVEEFKNIVEV